MAKKDTFQVEITPKKEFMLNLMLQHAVLSDGFEDDMRHFGLTQVLEDFKSEMQDKGYEMPWCNFPECRDKALPRGGCNHKCKYCAEDVVVVPYDKAEAKKFADHLKHNK